MLTDPTGGLGFAFGAILPSSQMSTITKQQPNALDATLGGSWTLGANATIAGAGEVRLNHLRLSAGGASYVDGNLTMSGTTNLKLASRSVLRAQPLRTDIVVAPGSLTWGAPGNIVDVKAATPGSVWWSPLTRLLHGATMDMVTVVIDPAGGHGAGKVTHPYFEVYKSNFAGNVLVATGDDPTDGQIAGGYEAQHNITAASPIGHVIDLSTYTYWLKLYGEVTGTSAYVANLVWQSCQVSCICTEMSEY